MEVIGEELNEQLSAPEVEQSYQMPQLFSGLNFSTNPLPVKSETEESQVERDDLTVVEN